jgi:hypothetical protein
MCTQNDAALRLCANRSGFAGPMTGSAKQSRGPEVKELDRFVASLLAMTAMA